MFQLTKHVNVKFIQTEIDQFLAFFKKNSRFSQENLKKKSILKEVPNKAFQKTSFNKILAIEHFSIQFNSIQFNSNQKRFKFYFDSWVFSRNFKILSMRCINPDRMMKSRQIPSVRRCYLLDKICIFFKIWKFRIFIEKNLKFWLKKVKNKSPSG
jgi:hypothetical protein